jgi:hypothetical protein
VQQEIGGSEHISKYADVWEAAAPGGFRLGYFNPMYLFASGRLLLARRKAVRGSSPKVRFIDNGFHALQSTDASEQFSRRGACAAQGRLSTFACLALSRVQASLRENISPPKSGHAF